jgi:hypothetical protein
MMPLRVRYVNDLVPEQVGVHPLFNAGFGRVLMDDLADAPCGERLKAVGFEKVRRSLLLAVAYVLRQLSAELAGKSTVRSFFPFPCSTRIWH